MCWCSLIRKLFLFLHCDPRGIYWAQIKNKTTTKLTHVDLLISLWRQTVQKGVKVKTKCCMCKYSWLNVCAHCDSVTPLKRETAFCSSPDSTPTDPRSGTGLEPKTEQPAAPDGIYGASKPAGGFPALPRWSIKCKTVRKVSFHTCSPALTQQNKVLQFTGETLSNKKRISAKNSRNWEKKMHDHH